MSDKLFVILFRNRKTEYDKIVLRNAELIKENDGIKKYISIKRAEALKDSGTNTGLLVFIQKLEEAFTWVNNYKK